MPSSSTLSPMCSRDLLQLHIALRPGRERLQPVEGQVAQKGQQVAEVAVDVNVGVDAGAAQLPGALLARTGPGSARTTRRDSSCSWMFSPKLTILRQPLADHLLVQPVVGGVDGLHHVGDLAGIVGEGVDEIGELHPLLRQGLVGRLGQVELRDAQVPDESIAQLEEGPVKAVLRVLEEPAQAREIVAGTHGKAHRAPRVVDRVLLPLDELAVRASRRRSSGGGPA